jgi:hypothetical protein
MGEVTALLPQAQMPEMQHLFAHPCMWTQLSNLRGSMKMHDAPGDVPCLLCSRQPESWREAWGSARRKERIKRATPCLADFSATPLLLVLQIRHAHAGPAQCSTAVPHF